MTQPPTFPPFPSPLARAVGLGRGRGIRDTAGAETQGLSQHGALGPTREESCCCWWWSGRKCLLAAAWLFAGELGLCKHCLNVGVNVFLKVIPLSDDGVLMEFLLWEAPVLFLGEGFGGWLEQWCPGTLNTNPCLGCQVPLSLG